MLQAEGTRGPKKKKKERGNKIAFPRNKVASADGADLSKRTLKKTG